MIFLTNLLYCKRHITESDNGYVPYCFFCNAVFSQSTSKICTLIRLFIFSNKAIYYTISGLVLLPYRFTLFSNILRSGHTCILFYYLIDLHYSQTKQAEDCKGERFYYLIDLHYSQTELCGDDEYNKVLLPYRFTLFSNTDLLQTTF